MRRGPDLGGLTLTEHPRAFAELSWPEPLEQIAHRTHQAAYLARYGSSPERSWDAVPVPEFLERYRALSEIIGAENGG